MTLGDIALFFGLWVQRPLRIAAICPSSNHVADEMGRFIELNRPGYVLELGGGTGGLTRGIVRAGCPPERLVVVEREKSLVSVLCREFAGITAIAGDATRLDALLTKHGSHRLAAVVSSLPIKWFSPAMQRAVLQPCFDRLGDGGSFLQLTNAFASPVQTSAVGVDGREVAKVWLNIPPAQIWRYTALTTEPSP